MIRVWTTISALGCVNWGNHLIQCAVELAAEKPETHLERISIWDHNNDRARYLLEDPRGYTHLIVPGSTVLDDPSLLDLIEKLQPGSAVTVIGGCFWNAPPSARAIEIWSRDGMKIGARDPYTQRVLRDAGIEAPLIGCPTMFWEEPTPASKRRLVVPGRQLLPKGFWQDPGAKNWTVVLHEEGDARQVPDGFPGEVQSLYNTTMKDAFSMYQNAEWIVTGRLHALLPALGRSPVMYYGDPTDTRNSLLPCLGVPIFLPEQVLNAPGQPLYRWGHRWVELRDRFFDFVNAIPKTCS